MRTRPYILSNMMQKIKEKIFLTRSMWKNEEKERRQLINVLGRKCVYRQRFYCARRERDGEKEGKKRRGGEEGGDDRLCSGNEITFRGGEEYVFIALAKRGHS